MRLVMRLGLPVAACAQQPTRREQVCRVAPPVPLASRTRRTLAVLASRAVLAGRIPGTTS